jgi:hypothetical protein
VDESGNAPIKLGPPGGGLPFHEWFVAKFLILPQYFRKYDWKMALNWLREETRRINELMEPLSDAESTKRVLVPKLRGLEDNSRYWSALMAIEHLIIVNSKMHELITSLLCDETPTGEATIQAVKPEGAWTDKAQAMEKFNEITNAFMTDFHPLNPDAGTAKYKHPWFGPLDRKQWLIFAALHTAIHRSHIKHIIDGMENQEKL